MKISRIKRTRPKDLRQIIRVLINDMRRSSLRRVRKNYLFIKWRGGIKKFDQNTHDPKERMAWGLDD